jgi:hypothetical protein
MERFKRLWSIVPVWLCLSVDVSLTLGGQSEEYWAGDYAAAAEANPFAHPLVAAGPWVFGLLAGGWAILLCILVLATSSRIIAWFLIALTVAHAIGASTWLARHGVWGWLVAIAYIFVVSEISWWCWRRAALASRAA